MDGLFSLKNRDGRPPAEKLIYNPINHGGIYSYRHPRLGPFRLDWHVFYPDVLPADWRFSFYCNQLRSVLVPAEAWSAASAAEMEVWAEDAFPEFRFVVELSAISPPPLTFLRRSDRR